MRADVLRNRSRWGALRRHAGQVGPALFGLAVVIGAAYAHGTAGMGLPPPWEDEGFFLWPALSVAESNTLLTEHLRPEGPILFMLMGHSVVLGAVFKILPFSLQMARWLSFTWMMAAAGLLAWAVRGFSLRGLAWGIIAWAALSRPFVVAGNIVRPEALCVLLVCTAMAVGHGRPWLALACLGIAPLIHPAGLFFVLAGVGAVLVIRPRNMWPLRPTDALALGCMSVAWLLMTIHVGKHWEIFIQDISYNLSAYPETLAKKARRLLLTTEIAPFLAICGGALLYWRKRRAERAWMAALSLGLFLVPASRPQMWYTVYAAVGQVIALCLLITTIAEWKTGGAAWRRAVAIATACAGMFLLYRDGALEGPRGYPRDMKWGWGMITENPAVRYWSETDRAILLQAMAAHLDSGKASFVTFMPMADALFFPEPATAGFTGYQPMSTRVNPDLVIFRESRYVPAWVRSYYTNRLASAVGNLDGRLIHQRNQSERWTLYIPSIHVAPRETAGEATTSQDSKPVAP